MKYIIAALTILTIAVTTFAQEKSLASQLFSPDGAALALAAGGVTAPAHNGEAAPAEATKLKPGRALMLSAMLPGTGEYYAGKKIRAAIFLAIEVAAWTGVIIYYNKGMQADKDFKKYADAHFSEGVYRAKEYELAIDAAWGDSGAYHGNIDQWNQETWDVKIHYLPDRGFTHELPSRQERDANASNDQQYYEMVGKYVHQFGFGWDDVYQIGGGFLGDDPSTPEYDDIGTAAKRSLLYMDMRYNSNQLLTNSSIAIQIAMLNHVASALDASFTVRAMNRKADAKVGFHKVDYDGHPMAVGGLDFQW